MKKILRLMTLLAAATVTLSCGLAYVGSSPAYSHSTRMTGYRYIENPMEQRDILRMYYPQLYNYYSEGLLEIVSMREKIYPGGRKDWDIKRRYVRRYINDARQRLRVLQRYYPDVYELTRYGAATVREMYEYVDNSGRIRYNVKWDRVKPKASTPRSAPRSARRPSGSGRLRATR